MTVTFEGRTYAFREIDTKGITQEQLQELANKTGRLTYEPRTSWLVINGIGYGWEER